MFLNKLFAFLMLLPMVALAQSLKHDVEITVPASSEVQSDTVQLGAIAQVYVKNIRQFQALSQLELAQFPSDRAELIVPGQYIRQRVQEITGTDASLDIQVPEVVHFTRGHAMEAQVDLAARIRELGQLKNKFPEGIDPAIEILSAQSISDPNIQLEASAEMPVWRGEMSFKAGQQWVRARIRWFGERWLSRRDVRFQEALQPDSFTKQRVELTALREQGLQAKSPEELSGLLQGKRAKRSIRAQMVLTEEMLDQAPDAKSGQGVKVIFISESGLRVETDGAIMQESHVGAAAKARLLKSKKVISGTLVSPNVIEVSL